MRKLLLSGTTELSAEVSDAGALTDDWEQEPLNKKLCQAGNQFEAAHSGSQAQQWRGVLKLISGLLVLVAVAAALTMLAAPYGQVLHLQRKLEDPEIHGTIEYPGTGCSNSKDVLLLERDRTSLSECAAACQDKLGCTGFEYQESCQPKRQCKLWNGNCTHHKNRCMAQHVMVSPKPMMATVRHPSTGCENWRDIGIGNLYGMPIERCTAACQETPGCTGFGYQKSCDEAERCILFSGNCTRATDDCWDYHDMEARSPLRYTKAPTLLTCIAGADSSIPMNGASGNKDIENLCVGAEWTGKNPNEERFLKTTYQFERAYQLVDQGVNDTLLVFVDGPDMECGGCSHEEFITRYTKISVSSSGAPVISGTGSTVQPPGARGVFPYDNFNMRRNHVLDAFQLKGNGSVHDTGPRYVNNSFLVGPPEYMTKVLSCMLQTGWDKNGHYDDQYGLAACMFKHPELVTLDYTGSLIAMHMLNSRMLGPYLTVCLG